MRRASDGLEDVSSRVLHDTFWFLPVLFGPTALKGHSSGRARPVFIGQNTGGAVLAEKGWRKLGVGGALWGGVGRKTAPIEADMPAREARGSECDCGEGVRQPAPHLHLPCQHAGAPVYEPDNASNTTVTDMGTDARSVNFQGRCCDRSARADSGAAVRVLGRVMVLSVVLLMLPAFAEGFVMQAPVMTVSEDSSCVKVRVVGATSNPCDTSTPLRHSYPGFATSIGGETLSIAATTSDDAAVAAVLFTTLPYFNSEDGELSFELSAHQFGEASFNVTDAATWFLLFIKVTPVNDAPSFRLVSSIKVIEEGGSWLGHVVEQVSAGPGEEAFQSVVLSLKVEATPAELFSEGPVLLRNGSLLFHLAPGMFGSAKLVVTASDTGGTDLGGVNTSQAQVLTVTVQPRNNPPSFTLPRRILRVVEGAGVVLIAAFATNVTNGLPNEDCLEPRVGCEAQKHTFVIEYVDKSGLFARLPSIDSSGNLTFEAMPTATGAARVWTRLEDDGGQLWSNSSASEQFSIVIEPVEHQAALDLPYDVQCLTLADIEPDKCSCPLLAEPAGSTVCSVRLDPHASGASVTVRESAGAQKIGGFMGSFTGAVGYGQGATTVFEVAAGGGLRFAGTQEDSALGQWGMEYASAGVVSEDGRNVYGVETDTDRVSVLRRDRFTGALEPLSAMVHNDTRLLLVGFNTSNRLDPAPLVSAVPNIREWELFVEGNVSAVGKHVNILALAACGAEALSSDIQRRKHTLKQPPGAGIAEERSGDPAVQAALVAFWSFAAEDIFTPMLPGTAELLTNRLRVNASQYGLTDVWDREALVTCDGTGGSCRFQRDTARYETDQCTFKWGCLLCMESHPPDVRFAAVPDLAGGVGPLVLTGPSCGRQSEGNGSIRTRTDWDVPAERLDLRSFMATNGVVGAMQFDPALSNALALALDVTTLVAEVPAQSILPRGAFTVELWVTVTAEKEPDSIANVTRRGLLGVEAYRNDPFQPGVQYCGKGWSLGYRHQKSATTFEWRVFSETSRSGTNEYIRVEQAIAALEPGEWVHLVGVFDQAAGLLRLFVNDQNASAPACSQAPCGPVRYPVPFDQENQLCDAKPYNFTVGTFWNGMNRMDPTAHPDDGSAMSFRSGEYNITGHQGLIHSIKIYKVALNDEQVRSERERKRLKMENNRPRPSFWSVKTEPDAAETPSPSIDWANMGVTSEVAIRGLYDRFARYRCAWETHEGEKMVTDAVFGGDTMWDVEVLVCRTPLWVYGVRLTRFQVLEQVDEGKAWAPLWQRACLQDSCGFEYDVDARAAQGGWFWSSPPESGVLLSRVSGMPKWFRFVAASSLHQFSQAPVGRGHVSAISIDAPGTNYLDGVLEILSEDGGKQFNASFSIDAVGGVTSTKVHAAGSGYDPTTGEVVLKYADTGLEQAGSISAIAVTDRGCGLKNAYWEVQGPASALLARGTLTVNILGEIETLNVATRGRGYTSDPVSGDLKIYYPRTLRLIPRSITAVWGDQEGIERGLGYFISGLGADSPAVASCSGITGCQGSGFKGTCLMLCHPNLKSEPHLSTRVACLPELPALPERVVAWRRRQSAEQESQHQQNGFCLMGFKWLPGVSTVSMVSWSSTVVVTIDTISHREWGAILTELTLTLLQHSSALALLC